MIDRRTFLAGCCLSAIALPDFDRFAFAISRVSELASDPRRPQFHLLPAANWMNDPNGPVYWNGKYHMFYQYNPNGAYWGDMHWGHAVSPDMIHWRHLPVALAPTPGGADAAGAFSGTAAINGNQVIVIYTAVVNVPEDQATARDAVHSLRETQCLAFSSDPDLIKWTKVPQPVLSSPPHGITVSGFRDPAPWQDGDWWYLTVGSGIRGKGGCVLIYRGKDLRHWQYLHVLTDGAGNGEALLNAVESGDMWECTQLFPLDNKYVLIYSTQGKVFWEVGVLDRKEMRFHREQNGVLDYGAYYAAKTQLDEKGNRIIWGWIPETRPLDEYKASGWAGMMSLPRVLTLDEDSNLCMEVPPTVQLLRKEHQMFKSSRIKADIRDQIAAMYIDDCCGEVVIRAKSKTAGFQLTFGPEPQHTAWLSVNYDPNRPYELMLDDKIIAVPTGAAEDLEFDFYVDGSVIETFINRRVSYTKRFYYPDNSAPRMAIRFNGRTSDLTDFSVWQLTPISRDRLTS